jgi:hypothetical protein
LLLRDFTGKLARNAAVNSNLETPGRAVVGFVDAIGINGDGTTITVSFNVVGKGTSHLTLENVAAYDAETLYDILTEITASSYQSEKNVVTATCYNLSLNL